MSLSCVIAPAAEVISFTVANESTSPDGERAAVQRLGLGIAALGVIQLGQVVEEQPNIGMVGIKCLFGDGERTLKGRLRLGITALGIVQQG